MKYQIEIGGGGGDGFSNGASSPRNAPFVSGAYRQGVWQLAERSVDRWLWTKIFALVCYVIFFVLAIFVSYYYMLGVFGFVCLWMAAWHKERAARKVLIGMIKNVNSW